MILDAIGPEPYNSYDSSGIYLYIIGALVLAITIVVVIKLFNKRKEGKKSEKKN